MSKIDKLTNAAARLSEDQLDGLIHFPEQLAQGPVLARAPAAVTASLQKGIQQAEAGELIDAGEVFAAVQRRIVGDP